MAQLDADQYKRLTAIEPTYGQSDGLYWDSTNNLLVLVLADTVVFSINASGTILAGALEAADLNVASQARGDLLRRGASAWERVSAKDSGKFLIGDGTDVISAAMSGDATLGADGAVTVADVTLGSDAAGDLHYKSSATALARLAKGTAAQFLQMNSGATAPQWSSLSGHGTVAAGGALTLDETLVQYATATISSANITGTGAGQLGHANGYELIAAPAAGKAIEVLSAVIINDYDTAAYTAGGNLTVNYGGGGSALTGAVSAANSLGAAADKVALVLATAPTNNQLSAATAVNLVAAAAFTNPGTAAGICRVKVAYRVHTTGL